MSSTNLDYKICGWVLNRGILWTTLEMRGECKVSLTPYLTGLFPESLIWRTLTTFLLPYSSTTSIFYRGFKTFVSKIVLATGRGSIKDSIVLTFLFFCFELICLFFLHILHCLLLQWFPKSLKSLCCKLDLLLPDFLVLSRWRSSLKGISYFFSFFGDSLSITRIYWWVASTVADLWKLLPFLFIDYLALKGNLNF